MSISAVNSGNEGKREKKKLIYLADGTVVDEFKWTKIIKSKSEIISVFEPLNLKGHQLTYEFLQESGFTHPILVTEAEGLDMAIPNITVPQVAELVGPDRIVDVLEVSTQTDRQMRLGEWAAYFTTPVEKRERILNVISLEIGESNLGKMVKRPKIVRELDWIDNVWPHHIRIHEYPRVQLYCLMGVQDSYTDFHIDFGGTSVFYHIISGEKEFYFIEPTKRNLDIYALWSTSPSQSTTFLGDLVPVCRKISLKAGQTLFIPSGWIHAVFTPQDTIVIGGNFLHCFAIESQLNIAQMEKDTNVPMRFRFPYFANMMWYAAKKYLYNLKDISFSFSTLELTSLQVLVHHLSGLASGSTNFQRLTKAERKTIRSEIPVGIKNVTLLLQNLQLALSCRRSGKRLVDDDEGWDSSVTEMEFVDSDDELEEFLPPDVAPLTDEEPESSEDDRGFESSDSDGSDSKGKKKRKEKNFNVPKKKVKLPIALLRSKGPNPPPNPNPLPKPSGRVSQTNTIILNQKANQQAVSLPINVKMQGLNSVPMLNGKPLILPKAAVTIKKTETKKKGGGLFDRMMKKMKKR